MLVWFCEDESPSPSLKLCPSKAQPLTCQGVWALPFKSSQSWVHWQLRVCLDFLIRYLRAGSFPCLFAGWLGLWPKYTTPAA